MNFEKFVDKMYKAFSKGKSFLGDPITLDQGMAYWTEFLFEKVCRMFEWNGLPFEQKHLENTLLINGYAGITWDDKYGSWVCPENGSLTGVTPYHDEFTDFVYSAPKCQGGTVRIFPYYKSGDAVILSNTTNRLSIMPMIVRYAALLAHTEITIKDSAILMRYDSILTGTTDSTIESLKAWRSAIEYGETHVPVLDRSLAQAPLVYPSAGSNKGESLLDALDARNELIRQFLSEIGVRQNKDKRGNMIADEVSQNDMSLLFNISDMIKQREAGAEILRQFSTDFANVSVSLSKEYDMIGRSDQYDGDN